MMTADPKVDLLRSVPLFASCSRRELDGIAALTDEIDLPAGRTFIREGTTAHEFFIILDGEVKVEHQGQLLRTMGPGDFLGEIALIDGKPRTATATAARASRLLVVGHREFRSLMASNPTIQVDILQALAARVRNLQPEAE